MTRALAFAKALGTHTLMFWAGCAFAGIALGFGGLAA
jgi:hypothetical protein